jgi:hypothetical protein
LEQLEKLEQLEQQEQLAKLLTLHHLATLYAPELRVRTNSVARGSAHALLQHKL